MDIQNVKDGFSLIEEGMSKLSRGSLHFYLDELTACYDLLINKYAPFKVDDIVILTRTPEISNEVSHGWMGAKHFLIKGARGRIQSVSCGSRGFRFDVIFDNETFIDYLTKEPKAPTEKHCFAFGEDWLVKV